MATSEAKIRALEIERLKLMLAKARREMFGQSSERGKLLVEQLELAIEDLEETQAEEEAKAENAAPGASKDRRSRAPRGPRKLPDNLPVERVVEPAPCACAKCGGDRLRKLGEDVTQTLEAMPRRWKVIETVREKFSCRDCETITQPPAPFHADSARLGRAEPAGDDRVREVRPASAAEPAEPSAMRAKASPIDAVDAGRRGRRRAARRSIRIVA